MHKNYDLFLINLIQSFFLFEVSNFYKPYRLYCSCTQETRGFSHH